MKKHTVEEVIAHREVLADILKNSIVVHRAINDLAEADISTSCQSISRDSIAKIASIGQAMIMFIKRDAENWLYDPRLDK